MAATNYVDMPAQRAYVVISSESRNPLRESIAAKVGLKTFCSVGLNHHTLQSAVVFLCRRKNPPLKKIL
jgi:hypothetical protein